MCSLGAGVNFWYDLSIGWGELVGLISCPPERNEDVMEQIEDEELSLELENRRRSTRFAIDLPLRHRGQPAQTINISATGIRFVSRTLQVGPEVEITLDLGGETIELSGETVWSEAVGNGRIIGAHFHPTKDLHKLCRYLSEVA